MASHSFRKNYEVGVETFYSSHGNQYKNPHSPTMKRVFRSMLNKWKNTVNFNKTLDLACGSGEATQFLKEQFERQGIHTIIGDFTDVDCDPNCVYIEGSDPFTYEAYEKRMGISASRFSFEDIEGGFLEGRFYDTIISSYAMHLIDTSRLYSTCVQLAMVSKHLIIVSPIKRPEITSSMGWNIIDQFVEEKIHVRLYSSAYF